MTNLGQNSAIALPPADSAATPARAVAPISRFRSYVEKQRFWLDPVGFVLDVHRNHGTLHAFGARRPEYVFVFHPELNRQVSDDGELFHWAANRTWTGSEGAVSILRASVSNMDGAAHRTRSQLMGPAFHRSVVARAARVVIARTDQLLAGWRTGRVRDVHEDIRRLVHAVSMEAVLGVRDEEAIARYYRLIDEIYSASGSVWGLLFPFDAPGTPRRAISRAADAIVRLMGVVIEE